MQLVIDFYFLSIWYTLYMFRKSSAHHQESPTVHTASRFCVCVSLRHCLVRVSYKTVPQADTNTETGGCMYSGGLLMMSAWLSKHVQCISYREKIKVYHKLHLLVYLLEYMKMHGPGNIKPKSFSMVQQPIVHWDLLLHNHTQTHSHCRCDFSGPVTNRRTDLYLTTHNTHKRETSMSPAGFKPTIPASGRWQTHV
jgi:hypothetical protein